VLRCEPAAFAAAARRAAANGASFPLRPGETIDTMLDRMAPLFFDASVDPVVTSKRPGDGRDILGASANNLYVDVAMADLAGFEERYR